MARCTAARHKALAAHRSAQKKHVAKIGAKTHASRVAKSEAKNSKAVAQRKKQASAKARASVTRQKTNGAKSPTPKQGRGSQGHKIGRPRTC